MGSVLGFESEFFREIPFFSGLPEDDVDEFIKSACLRHYKKNEYIYHQGDEADRFFIVLSGWVSLYRETIDGDETVSDLLTRGDIFGEGIIFYQNNNYIFSAQVVEQGRIIEIPKTVLRYRAEENPDILKRIMGSVCEKMIRLQTDNERLVLLSATQRVACLLLRLSAHMVGNGGTFTFPYDKSLAAAQLGMKRETFSRALMHLDPLGVAVNGSEIKIESFRRLTEFSCKHCTLGPGQCAGARFSACDFYNVCNNAFTDIHSFRGA